MPDEPTTMSSYLAYLPAIMQQSAVEGEPSFLGQFLLAFEQVLTGLPATDSHEESESEEELGLEETIARLYSYFDARETPEAFVSWLAGWVAIGLREEWPVDKQRDLIAEAVVLYRKRGTRAGLLHLLQTYTDLLDVDVQELIHTMQVGVVSTVGVDTVLGSGPPHYFLVHVTMPAGDDSDIKCGDWDFRCRERLARAIVDKWKPAHTYYDLVVHYPPTMQVEVRSTVGEDTFLGPLPG